MNKDISNQAHEFVVYVRTQMFYRSRLKGKDQDLKVYISSKEIDQFFPFQKYDRTHELETLVQVGELKVTERISPNSGNIVYFFEAMKAGEMDIRYMKAASPSNDPLLMAMKRHLKNVTMPPGFTSTSYFNAFLMFKDQFIDVFFTQDEFSGRIHTPVSNLHSEYRHNILLYGQPTVGLDVAQMQPSMLGEILKAHIGDNVFSRWIDSGMDIYRELQQRAGLETRDQGKKRFFEILFSKPSDQLVELFGGDTWINWVNDFKKKNIPENPHGESKPHSNLAWLLQTNEVRLMRKVWTRLSESGIPFVSVHDEVIVRKPDARQAKRIMNEVISDEFVCFTINSSKPSNTAPGKIIPEELETRITDHFLSFKLPYSLNDPGDIDSLVSGFRFETGIEITGDSYKVAALNHKDYNNN